MLFYAKRTLASQLLTLICLLGAALLIATARGISLGPFHLWPAAGIGVLAYCATASLDLFIFALHALVCGYRFVVGIFETLIGILGDSTISIAIGAGTVAGIGEEALFRGAIQSWLGFWPTVLLFTLAHMGTRPLLRLLVWTAWEGVVFGVLYKISGFLICPMIAHGLHDTAAILALRQMRKKQSGLTDDTSTH